MEPTVRIADVVIWFKHIENPQLRKRLQQLPDNELINLEVDGVVGRWVRMKTGKDGRRTEAIRPEGAMKEVWKGWYADRRGEILTVREVRIADDYLITVAPLFAEWNSPEDEEAFCDL